MNLLKRSSTPIVNWPMADPADKRIHELTIRFALTLLYQAKLLAYKRKDDFVLSNHVDEAFRIYMRSTEPRWWTEFLLALGGGLFGAALPAVQTELDQAGHTQQVIIWLVVGFVGLLMMFGAIISRLRR